jgi:hypothetical protein
MVNSGMEAAMESPDAAPAPRGSRYGDQRPYTIAGSLADLHAATTGLVHLDRRLHWSQHPGYDLSNPRQLATMYETVLREASNPDELARWLDGPTLVRLWDRLVLPPRLRRLWESRFPELARTHPSAA